ncbi:hypothetical protein PFMALIP_02547 [Plasmodium falciparum MaliPS096_E11]|uniref:Uncharacterized protein n=1 Tax=Plasmodium falciparum MaliPS096_E11 TaxID=1036727 RepID=A0A024WQ84_PLAFA|nr:hypothetical protein PFMALIP_02547 [Plasmodium falciparum MaliPS096_E11]
MFPPHCVKKKKKKKNYLHLCAHIPFESNYIFLMLNIFIKVKIE